MNTDITKATPSEVYSFGANESWGAIPSATDIMVPKLMLMQNMSEAVSNGTAKPGDVINSLEGNILSTKDEKLEVIVFDFYKTVQTFIDGEYDKTESYTSEVGNLPYEEVIGGKKINRTHVMNFYVLLPQDIESGEAFPYVVSFKRTSMATGRKLATMLTKLRMFNKPSSSYIFELGRTMQKNDKGSFFVWTVDKSRSSTMDEVLASKLWYDQLKIKSVAVDEKDV